MLDYFTENKLKLNLKKSGYLFINSKENDLKETIYLSNGILEYKHQISYLGVIFSDIGRIMNDIRLFITDKRSNITVKYSNFCSRNYLAPLKIKLSVLESCVMSSLTYSCETWGNCIPSDLETIYRMGIKTALSVRFNTCNEIAYIESSKYPAVCMIKKRQYKFWSKLNQNLVPGSSLEKLLNKARNIRLPYIAQFENLLVKYDSAINCEVTLQSEFANKFSQQIKHAYYIDIDSKLGTYLQVNPDLIPPIYQNKMFELERIHITRIRTGSHNLIETGGFSTPKVPRELRLCMCGNDIHTLRHVLLMDCVIVLHFMDSETLHSVSEFFNWNHIHEYIVMISKMLKVEL